MIDHGLIAAPSVQFDSQLSNPDYLVKRRSTIKTRANQLGGKFYRAQIRWGVNITLNKSFVSLIAFDILEYDPYNSD